MAAMVTAKVNTSAEGVTFTATSEDGASTSIVELVYLAEGGANVVYRIKLRQCSDEHLDALLTGKVLRVRKEQAALSNKSNTADAAPPEIATSSTFAVYDYFEKRIKPLVPQEFLLGTALVKLSEVLLKELNAALQQADAEGLRAKNRQGTSLDINDPYALVLENMQPVQGSTVTLEIKPKWLSDSANPSRRGEPEAGSVQPHVDRRRCRTCALRAARKSRDKGAHHAGSQVEICPLVWTQGKDADRSRAVHTLIQQHRLSNDTLWAAHGTTVTDKLNDEFLYGSIAKLFTHLAKTTLDLDPNGVDFVDNQASTEEEKENIALAMTLRDCTLFVNFDWACIAPLRMKLADLDRKDWRTKLERWSETEAELVGNGWYDGRDGAENDVCMLWPWRER